MCGIAGIVEPPGRRPDRAVLERMGEAIRHRGPDDGTVAVFGRAGLSFRRLSIIDVEGGAQPIASEDGECQVIVNGEIYNHEDLRSELEGKGHRFETRSDVEVVVHGYEEWGDGIVERLRGMFALALWDQSNERLLLARDRLGQKPLLYRHVDGRLSFASEFQALVADPETSRDVDPIAIHQYLTYLYVPAPRSAYTEIRKVPPGHLLVFEKQGVEVRPYWRLEFAPLHELDEHEAVEETRSRLREAVRLRLMSDVPLGAFLSGGIDSSAVVAMMAEFGPVKTFSVGFEEQDFSELAFARMVADRYGTDHHEVVVRPEAAEVLPKLVDHYGEPYADSSALPTYYLSRVTAEHVKVALNGDAGDELFAGYDRYRLMPAYAALSLLPGIGELTSGVARGVGSWLPSRPLRLLEAISGRPEESYARTVSCFSPELKRALYTPEMQSRVADHDSFRSIYELFSRSDAADLLGRTLHVDTLSYLPNDLLVKVDIATMANGLEGRSPFLDHPLVEFAARLPSRLKRRSGKSKHVLRRAVRDLLPDAILRRRKMGFGVPIGRWLRGDLGELVSETLLAPRPALGRFIRPEGVRRLVGEHRSQRRDHSQRLWSLLMLELWLQRFVERPSGS